MKTIDDFHFKDKTALVRVDFNVPLKDGKVTDNTRIRRAKPTIDKIMNDGGKAVLMSHLGRPKGPDPKYSLKQIVDEVEKVLGRKVHFSEQITGPEAEAKAAALKPGEILLLENLRFDPREKKGDPEFARQLARLGDIYVNDAFGTAHRAHASTAVIARYFPGRKAAGYLLADEIKHINQVLHHARHPFTAIIGGAKISSKIGVIENLLNLVDNLVIVGGMAYTFLKALGYETGRSLVEEDYVDTARNIMEKAKVNNIRLVLPVDIVVADQFDPAARTRIVKADQIPADWMGLDIGPETARIIHDVLMPSKTIVWNGPAGVFEWDKFAEGTKKIAESVAMATEKGAYSLVGGGDSVAAIEKYGLADKISYISTGGGAMLEMLEGKTLPGIKALEEDE